MSTNILLLPTSTVTFGRTSTSHANDLLERWQHRLGPCRRPFGQEAYLLTVADIPVSIAVSASTVSASVAGYRRKEVVELARLCSAPSHAWASRVTLRLWREVAGPLWSYWPIKAAVSYSHNAHHTGDIYRFDGWLRVRDDCGDWGGRATWSTKREPGHPATGTKTLWLWRYASSDNAGCDPEIPNAA